MMVGFSDVYKICVVPMAPLFFALFLGFMSARWWRRTFTPAMCSAVNSLMTFLAMPFFVLQFTMHADPFNFNYRAVAADVISKVLIAAAIAVWVRFFRKGGSCASSWSITSFSLSTLTNSLVVGVPMARAMYGEWAQQLVVQLSVVQAVIWLPLLLLVLEVRKAAMGTYVTDDSSSSVVPTAADSPQLKDDVEAAAVVTVAGGKPSLSLWAILEVVARKVACNPKIYASIIGITWAWVSSRLHIELPRVFEGCVLVMSKPAAGMAMFSMGMFMAQQEKLLPCGPSFAVLGLVLKFGLGPASMALGSIAVGLRGDVLRVAIIQAAVPQSITSFIFAKEYGLHADILSTAVILGMLVSLPLLVGFYLVLELIG